MEDSGIVGRLARVSRPVVRRFVQSVSDQAVGMGVIRGVKPDQQLVKVSVPVYTAGTEVKPAATAKEGLKEAKNNVDVVIMDTAGRADKGMMNELKDVKKVLNPTEVLLTGQEAAEEREKPELLAESLERRKELLKIQERQKQVSQLVAQIFQTREEDEELDGSNGRRIHSCFKRARGRNESRTKGFLFTFHVYGEDDEQNRAGGSVPSPHDRRQNSEEENEYAAQVTEQPDASENQKEDNDGWETVGKKKPARQSQKVKKEQWQGYKCAASEQHYSDDVETHGDLEPSQLVQFIDNFLI
ncbi:hypothetical protein Bca52824_089869 [Brassica carinata]|uniref:SRP54-type proteins GTP-binding domain-containing protein n=1 Tax=Brassica carinata TaxID=52824 RepID=A0A8X7TES3_BRACI|nr:hypothetical protein Bca52824_089869 [Brassica carinata]